MSYARVNFGMGRAEFMRTTPRYFARLTREHREARERSERTMEFMLAQLTSMVANTGFKGWEQRREDAEFMPSRWSKEEKPKAIRRPRKARIEAIRASMMRLCA